MKLAHELKQIGLNSSEATIYLYLLEQGMATPPQIAKGTGIARTNTYHILRSLKEQRLIKEQYKGKRKIYLVDDPSSLSTALERKLAHLETLLPDLRALFKQQKNKPAIKFYEGFDEVHEIFAQTLAAEEILGIASTNQLAALTVREAHGHMEWYSREIKKRHIIFRGILTADSREQGTRIRELAGALYEPRYLPERHADVPTDILVWNGNVALMTLEEPVFGTVLANKPLADTLRVVFEVLWNALPNRE